MKLSAHGNIARLGGVGEGNPEGTIFDTGIERNPQFCTKLAELICGNLASLQLDALSKMGTQKFCEELCFLGIDPMKLATNLRYMHERAPPRKLTKPLFYKETVGTCLWNSLSELCAYNAVVLNEYVFFLDRDP